MIRRILIANRGEIAVRIIRTCREMGIETVAVFSTADREALHVQLATDSVCIGGPRPADSYLNMNNIIQAAINTGCDAIHPGFGFLSENPTFARLVTESGLVFIGPSRDVMERMGNKSVARRRMVAAGIPVVPGSDGVVSTVEQGIEKGRQITYPLMIKASAGGGGRGIRVVNSENEFESAFLSAKSEALTAFGNDDVYLEKYIRNPKHIEVQILADKHGNVIHLYERDCSFQRRNQKMIEEAPCFKLDDATREKLVTDAVKACKAVGYDSVGTVEFLLDKDGNHYFMEMNTRIQVEHPVTEMVCNVDIVRRQIRSANGQTLAYSQQDIHLSGYAMECRINAENIRQDFAPAPGTISFLHLPGGKGVRIDTAVYSEYAIPPYYDSMILKLITFAPTRLECIKKMRGALEELIIGGVETNIEFHYLALHSKKFVEGSYDTSFAQTFIQELKDNEYIV